MKKSLTIIALLILSLKMMAQQDPKFSQNMFIIPAYNPGAVGHSDKICAGLLLRNQWMGLPNAPTVVSFNAHAPFRLLGRSHGVGLTVMNDNIGFNTDYFMSVSYSYKIDIGNGLLGLGLNAGFANQSINPEWITADVMQDPGADFAIPDAEESHFGFDMGLGAYYAADNLYVGVSTTHLNQTNFDYISTEGTGNVQTRLQRHFYAIAGYTIQLTNPMFELMPAVMLQTDGRSNDIYLNTNLRYNKRFWGGVSYTVGGAITALAGVELLNGIRVGAAYDIELSPLISYNTGSLELTIRYCFDLSLDKSPQKYESIRFL